MNARTPTLRQTKDGRWLTKWGGKGHYFGRDPVVAARRYAESLERWKAWQERKSVASVIRTTVFTIELAEQFCHAKKMEGDQETERYYRKHIQRFVNAYADVDASSLNVSHLHKLKADMLEKPFAPKTINHDLGAVKAMLMWGMDREIIPEKRLKGCKSMPLGPATNETLSTIQVCAMISDASDHIMPWLAINYLALARPSEVVRAVHKQGKWVENGIFRLDKGKIDKKARLPRHLVFSDEAMKWLVRCRPLWSRLDSYSAAVRRACGAGGPRVLRKSAATHLHQLHGVDRADIDLLLGHAPPRVSLTYTRINWQPLRGLASRLSL